MAGPVTIADSDANLSDLDNANLQSFTVTITNLLNGVSETLLADTTGTSIIANYNITNGVLNPVRRRHRSQLPAGAPHNHLRKHVQRS